MKKKKSIYQSGGEIPGLEGILSSFGSLFGDLTFGGSHTPPDIKPLGFSLGEKSFNNQDDLLRSYYTDQINQDIPKHRKRKRRKAREALDDRFKSGDIYNDPESQNIINQGRMGGINQYFSSPEFQQGAAGLLSQFSQHQQNLQSEGGDSVDQTPYLVGHDRGFKKGGPIDYKQYGGFITNPSLRFLSEEAGIDPNELNLFAEATRAHESYGDYTITQMNDGPGRGAYQFDKPSLKTAARKAKMIYKEMEETPPAIYDEIIKGAITEAHQLSPSMQDELFFSSLTKVVPVKDKNGKIKRYSIKPTPSLSKYDLSTPAGLAETWQKVHNRGKIDRRESFLSSLDRLDKFEKGGAVDMDPNFIIKYNKAKEGDIVPTSDGGEITKSADVSFTGYRNDSPDKNAPELIIPGDTISMKNVDLNLLLIPETGEPVIATSDNPDQLYRFPGSSYVKEIPLDNNYQMGGPVEPKAIQTERGEMLVFEDNTISPVKAKKLHKQMKSHELTDIVPGGKTFVLSRDKNMKLNKKDAEKISFGYGPLNYKENESGEVPKEMLFSDVYKRSKETPAQLGKNIIKKYPITTRKDDSFAARAKDENKESRFPFIETLKYMSEMKRNPSENFQMGGGVSPMLNNIYKQPTNNAITGSMYQDARLKMDNNMKNQGVYTKPLYSQSPTRGLPGNQKFFQDGGTPDPTGGAVQQLAKMGPALLNFVGDIFGFSAGAKARKRLEEYNEQTISDVEGFQSRQSGRNQLGYNTGMLSTIGQFASQDPSYDFLDIDSIRSRTRNAYQDVQDDFRANMRLTSEKAQAPINTAVRSLAMADPRQAQAIGSSMYAQHLDAEGNRTLQQNAALSQLRLQGENALNNLDFTEAQDRQRGTMFERAGRNVLNQSLAQGVAQETQNYLTQEGQTDMATLAAKMGARGQFTTGMNQLGQLAQDNRNQAISSLGDLYTTFANRNQPSNISPTTQVGVGSQTSGLSQDYQNYTVGQQFNTNNLSRDYQQYSLGQLGKPHPNAVWDSTLGKWVL